ncbi:MAG TPA: M28 family metallopeptidase [Solirubrobacteraceae bacterium]|nr:M28 family metallopeptidase [Solirubrobacteraceae bacterium]
MGEGVPKILVIVLVVQLVIGGAIVYASSQDFFGIANTGSDSGTTTASAVSGKSPDRFDEGRAWKLLVEQVETFGPRPAGSEASARLRARLRDALPRGRYEKIPGHPKLRNVVGVVPGTRPAVVIGAHYDTEALPKGHVGANDGAAGTAALVELARTARTLKRPAGAPELRFVAFDGEEEPAGCEPFEKCGLRGSKAYARKHGKDVKAMVLLDYIAEKGTRFPREGTSDIELWDQLRAAARRVGAGGFFLDEVGASIIDDHAPFLERGIPAIDLIDFDYRFRDTLEDTPDKLSVRSLDAVGEAVAELLRTDLAR